MSDSQSTLLLADGAARRMAHKFAKRKGLREERGEEIIDHAAPLVWAQRVPPAFPNDAEARDLMASAIALLAVQRAKKVAYDALVLEREALAEWAARRTPSSQFVGDDGSDAEYVNVARESVENLAHLIRARQAIARLVGYVPLWELPAYHA